MKVSIVLEIHDFWVGLYWRYDKCYALLHIYICLIPCLPIHITFDFVRREARKLAKMIIASRRSK